MFASSPKWPALAALLAVLILVFISPGAFASSGCIVTEFDKTFGGQGDDDGRFVQQTAAGDYIIVGSTKSRGAGGSDVWLIKADRDGNQMWNRTFGGPKDDWGEAVLETLDAGYIIVGATRSKGVGGYDIWAIKTDKDGSLVWDETFGDQLDDEGQSVVQTADGGYIITGRSRASDSGGRYDALLLKIDGYGNRIWLKSFGGPLDDEGDSVLQTADGGYIIAGTTSSFGAGGYDAWLIKTDQSGNKIWDRTFGGQNSELNPWCKGWFVEQVRDGGYILSGSTISYGSGGYDAWLIRTDMEGNEIWNRTFGGALDDEGAAVMQTVDGNYILLGSTSSYGAGGYDAWLINIDQDGREIWKKTLGGKTDDKGYFVQQTNDGGYIVVGKTLSSSPYSVKKECCLGNDISSRNQAWLVKVRSESPVIITQPQSLSVCEGQAAAFAVSAIGKEPLSYQWKKNGVEIYKATENTYIVQSAGLDDAGLYSVTVSNSCGLIESIPSRLDVNTKPSIQVQPLSQTVCEDFAVVMSVDASGTKPFAYQWKKNGEEILGATANIYEISRASTNDTGNYSAVMSNICGSVESDVAILTVNSMPSIQVQPASQTICAGSNAAFGVEATGSEPINYQWKKNGVVIEAASSRTFSIINARASDAGTYSVLVSNNCGSVESEMATLVVNSPPSIQVQPLSQETCAGSSITFSIKATGTQPLLYQWMKNGESISGADENAFRISSTTAEDTGTYSVMVSNGCGSVESSMVTLTVNSPPSIQVQPLSQETCAGSSITFRIEATGTQPLSYQWMKNGENISGAIENTLSISGTTVEDSGSYGVMVSNGCGSVESSMAALTVNSPPLIRVQPLPQEICAGSSVTLSTEATGTQPLLYQWMKNGENISGANRSVFIISSSTPEDAGTYSVMVSNSCGSVESEMATLVVNSPPSIQVQPLSQETCAGSSITFRIEATGTQLLSYQWMKNGENISGAIENTHSISGTTVKDSGSYSVIVSNVCGSVKSSISTLTVNSAPTIHVQPFSQETCTGSSVTLSIEATGTPPLLYLWMKNGENISGANGSVFIISSSTPEDAGTYSVMVSNSCGAVESSMAALTVNSPPSIRVQSFSQETCAGSSVILSIEATGTQPLTYQWMKNGENLPGANANAFSILNTIPEDAGSYSAMVSNGCGAVESEIATLTINSMPSIRVQPLSQETCAGSSITFGLEATGTMPLTYQWMKNGENLSGANANAFSILNTTMEDSGSYSVVVINGCGAVESEIATLTVDSMPSIRVQPLSQETCAGSSVAFSLEATGTMPLTYQWMKNGENIFGANANAFSIVSTTTEDAGSYSVMVSNGCGAVESEIATLTIDSMPSIQVQPLCWEGCLCSGATFSVKASGTEPLSYQWKKDGLEIPAANQNSYTVHNASMSDEGCYSVVAYNKCGFIESNAATLAISKTPCIITHPISQTCCECNPKAIAFSVAVTGPKPMFYQWKKDGRIIPGACSNELSISDATSSDSGNYTVVVSNRYGSIESNAATLNVNRSPQIAMKEPTCREISAGESITLGVRAMDRGPLLYQWMKNGLNISGATSSTYTVRNVTKNDTGNYRVLVSNGNCQVESNIGTLKVVQVICKPRCNN